MLTQRNIANGGIMEIKANYLNHYKDKDGNVTLSFRLQGERRLERTEQLHQLLIQIASQNKPLKIAIEVVRDKRSTNANSYAWELLGKLAKKLNIPSIELYRKYVYDLQIKRQVKVDVNSVNTLTTVWKERGIAWIAEKVDEEKGFAIVDLYYGSSSYNSKQMSKLLSMIVEDCELQGIDTRTPDEIAKMISLREAK